MVKLSLFIRILGTVFILMLLITSPAQTLSSNYFPQNWQGTWSGRMSYRSVGGMSQSVPMTLRIQPISKNPTRYTWQITYGSGVRKDYELFVKDQDAGHFVIDEKDGTLIDAWLFGDKLYSQFRLEDNLFNTRYERQSHRLRYELVEYKPVNSPQKKDDQQKLPFQSYQLQVVQSAELSLVTIPLRSGRS